MTAHSITFDNADKPILSSGLCLIVIGQIVVAANARVFVRFGVVAVAAASANGPRQLQVGIPAGQRDNGLVLHRLPDARAVESNDPKSPSFTLRDRGRHKIPPSAERRGGGHEKRGFVVRGLESLTASEYKLEAMARNAGKAID